jgi:two-component system, NarL family, nitrate/nitrite response regulator NarL
MAAPPIRIVVIDDSPLYRRTIRKILEKQPNLKIVAEAGDGVYGIQTVKTHRPDVVIMDVTLPILNGIEATRKIKSEFPKVRVIVLSAHDAESISAAAHGAGASWYLNKDCSPNELIKAIMTAENE